MKPIKTILAVALLGATMSFANGQGFRMMMGGGGMSQGMVLFQFGQGGMTVRDDVGKELKLTDAQKTKLDDYQQKQREEMMARFQGGGERPSQEEIQKIFKKSQEDLEKAIKEILDESQQKRLHELWIQRLGNGAIAVESLQKDLGVTEDQKAKVKTLQKQRDDANKTLGEKMMNGEIDRSEMRPLMEKTQKVYDDELAKIVTDDQKAKIKTMGGAVFKFDDGGQW